MTPVGIILCRRARARNLLPKLCGRIAWLNQLYHDHGVALTKARHADTAVLRDGFNAQAGATAREIKRAGSIAPVLQRDDRFEVFRADEVQVTSTQFVGGDWRWRLADGADRTLVEASGYRSERECRSAMALLHERASAASLAE